MTAIRATSDRAPRTGMRLGVAVVRAIGRVLLQARSYRPAGSP